MSGQMADVIVIDGEVFVGNAKKTVAAAKDAL